MAIESKAQALRLYSAATALEDAGDWGGALSLRKELLAFAPSDEKFILTFAKGLSNVGQTAEAEDWYRKAIFLKPYSELSSLHLFHFLWDSGRTDDAFIEIKRFQSIAHSNDYMEIVREINEKAPTVG